MSAPETHLVDLPVQRLRIGHYICDLNKAWWAHEFVRNTFKIDSTELLSQVQGLGAGHLVKVDLSKSDPEGGPEAVPAGQSDTADAKPELSGSTTVEAESAERSRKPAAPKADRVPIESEMDKARKLVARAKLAIASAMRDGRTGQIKNLGEVQDIAAQMVESATRNPGALHTLAMLKTADDYTYTHCVAVGAFMISLGRCLGLDEQALRHAGTAGLMHDVGKAGIEPTVLNKPGKLTDQEFSHVRLHPVIGEQLLRDAGYSDDETLDVVRHHHERIDGRGYPDGLSNSQVSLLARMGAVTDVYDAVTSNRVYHKAMAPTAALQMMLKNCGAQFDQHVVHSFIRTVGMYPNGSLVGLKSNKLAVVKEQHPVVLGAPIVRVFYSMNNKLPLVPTDIDLSRSNDSIVAYFHPADQGLSDQQLLAVLGVK